MEHPILNVSQLPTETKWAWIDILKLAEPQCMRCLYNICSLLSLPLLKEFYKHSHLPRHILNVLAPTHHTWGMSKLKICDCAKHQTKYMFCDYSATTWVSLSQIYLRTQSLPVTIVHYCESGYQLLMFSSYCQPWHALLKCRLLGSLSATCLHVARHFNTLCLNSNNE